MESVARFKATLDLGKRLVAQLELSDDLLAQWMAHDISARIEAAETAPPEREIAARDDCAKSILALWKHRNELPPQFRVFKEIDPLIRTLVAIDVGRANDNFFFSPALRNASLEDAEPEMRKFLKLAFGIDRAARELIQWALRSAGEAAASDAKPWIVAALRAGLDPLAERYTTEFIIGPLPSIGDDDEYYMEGGKEDDERFAQQEALRERIKTLKDFADMASNIAAELGGQLD